MNSLSYEMYDANKIIKNTRISFGAGDEQS